MLLLSFACICKDLIFSIAQIMKLYESSNKVDSKVSFPEIACASYFVVICLVFLSSFHFSYLIDIKIVFLPYPDNSHFFRKRRENPALRNGQTK